MQVSTIPFKPIWGSTVAISATTTSANVAIPAVAAGATAVRVRVTGSNDARWRAGGDNTVAAVAGDPMLGVSTVETFGINPSATYVAAKCDSGTATVEFTFGFGS